MGQVLDPTDLDLVEDAELVTEQRRELLRDRRARDVARLMAQDWGRRFVRHLFESNFLYSANATNNGVEMQRNEGRRLVAIDLLGLIQSVCPERLIQMDQEALQERNDREQADGD